MIQIYAPPWLGLILIYLYSPSTCTHSGLADMLWCHHDTEPLRCELCQYACGCATWVCSSEIKRFWCKSDRTSLAQIVKRPTLTNACKQRVCIRWRTMSVSNIVSSTVLQMSWISLLGRFAYEHIRSWLVFQMFHQGKINSKQQQHLGQSF